MSLALKIYYLIQTSFDIDISIVFNEVFTNLHIISSNCMVQCSQLVKRIENKIVEYRVVLLAENGSVLTYIICQEIGYLQNPIITSIV